MVEIAFKWFVYADRNGGKIRIKAKRKPGPRTIPLRGVWIVQEWATNPTTGECKWQMPCFPEITWGTLSRLTFVRREAT